MSYLSADDLVYTSDSNNNIYSGGFRINSIFLKNGISPIKTYNNNLNQNFHGGNKKVSDLFENLVVPSWLLGYDTQSGLMQNNHSDNDSEDDFLDESLHEKLFSIMQPTKKKFTKQNKKNHNNKTKKYLKKN